MTDKTKMILIECFIQEILDIADDPFGVMDDNNLLSEITQWEEVCSDLGIDLLKTLWYNVEDENITEYEYNRLKIFIENKDKTIDYIGELTDALD